MIHFLVLLLICYLRWQQLARYGMTMQLYHEYSRNLRQGQMPYRDFSFEYPPLALLPIVLPQLIKADHPVTLAEYAWLFTLENALISVLLGLTVVRIASFFQPWRHCLRVLIVYILLSIISAPLLLGRYDLFPTLLTGIAVAAAISGHSTQSGLWLGFGFAMKLYPIVLLPILSIYYLVSRNYSSLLKVLVGVTIAICLILLPFLHIGIGQLLSFLDYHRVRGLQIESIPAGIILSGYVLGATHVTVGRSFGAVHLTSPISDTILKWLPILSVLAFTFVAISCLQCFGREFNETGSITNESLLVYLMSALLTFIVVNKIFSPQYLGWLLPFAAFLRIRQVILLVVIFVMTIIIYPFTYDDLLALQTPSILLLNVRNFLTIGLLVWLVTERLSASNTAVARLRPFGAGG
jgi:hypothetical protein